MREGDRDQIPRSRENPSPFQIKEREVFREDADLLQLQTKRMRWILHREKLLRNINLSSVRIEERSREVKKNQKMRVL